MENLNRRLELQTCREQHAAVRILMEVFPTKPPFDAAAVSDLVTRLARLLTAHFKLEDGRLYPALEKSSDRGVRRTAVRYRVEMGDLKSRFTTFLSAWKNEAAIASDPRLFITEWVEVRKLLEIRMAKEDHGLYAIAEDYLSSDTTA